MTRNDLKNMHNFMRDLLTEIQKADETFPELTDGQKADKINDWNKRLDIIDHNTMLIILNYQNMINDVENEYDIHI